jgi:hypothetical protein
MTRIAAGVSFSCEIALQSPLPAPKTHGQKRVSNRDFKLVPVKPWECAAPR